MKSILEYWPIPEFEIRPNQLTMLNWLEANRDKKYLLIQAPVGSGKSLVAATFASYIADTSDVRDTEGNQLSAGFYLTPQIILQKQYETSFPKDMMASLYGKSNYPCARIHSTCDVGSALKKKCRGGCPYNQAKTNAQLSEHVVLNYKLALLQFYYTQTWANRHVIIHDECHGLEEYLTELTAPSTSAKRCERYSIRWKHQHTLDTALDWISEVYLPGAAKYHSALYSELQSLIEYSDNDPTPAEARKLKELNALEEHIDEFQSLLLRS